MDKKFKLLTIRQAAQLVEGLSEHHIRKLIKENELPHIKTGYSCDYRDINKLREILTDNTATLLLVHHTRKMYDPDPLNTLSGSTGLVGAVDRVWVLEKEKSIGLDNDTHVETVVLLSHKSPDSHINVTVEFGDGEDNVPLNKIVQRAETYKPKERVTYKMINEYIEAKYGFKVHSAYIAEVKGTLGLPMHSAPNAVEDLKQPQKIHIILIS